MPDGQTVTAHGEDSRLRLYDLDTGWQRGGDINVTGMLRIWDQSSGCRPGEPIMLSQFDDGLIRGWDVSPLDRQNTAAANRARDPAPLVSPQVHFTQRPSRPVVKPPFSAIVTIATMAAWWILPLAIFWVSR